MTGDIIDAAEAERIGLVNKVVPHDKLMEEAMDLARRLANGPAMAIRGTKHAINKKVWADLNLSLDMGLALEERSSRHPDHNEAARSYVEKRTPEYKGTIKVINLGQRRHKSCAGVPRRHQAKLHKPAAQAAVV